MSAGEALTRKALEIAQHFTEPPPRFSEASLVKRMEELGIGRPSTYASILQVLQDRGYVKIDKKRMHAEDKGRVVVAFLESFFARYVEFDFTASLEEQLDRISNNEIGWRDVLRDFWKGFIGAVDEIKDLRVSQVLDALNELLGPHIFPAREDGGDARQCPTCGTGQLSLKAGKFGAFVGCSNYPECRYTRPLAATGDDADTGDRVIGKDPETGLDVTIKSGRFGPYIQLGEGGKDEKPKRAGIPKGLSPSDVELDLALGLLSLPREVGKHPETGQPIIANNGRFGPYVQHEKTYASLESRRRCAHHRPQSRGDTDRRENRQGTGPRPLRRGPRQGARRSPHRAAARSPRRTAAMALMSRMTASTPLCPTTRRRRRSRSRKASELIDARAAKGGGKKGGARKSAAKKAAPKKDPAPRKAPAKKAAAKKVAPKKTVAKKAAAKSKSTKKAVGKAS